jgi:hypothetical protein
LVESSTGTEQALLELGLVAEADARTGADIASSSPCSDDQPES